MRVTTNLRLRRAAGTSAALTLGLFLGAGLSAHTETGDQAQSTSAAQTPDQEPTQPPQQPAQPTEPGQPEQPASPSQPGQKAGADQPPQQTFTSDTAIIFYAVLPDKVTQFEQLMNKVKEAMQKSDNPSRKQQAEGMRLLKASKPGPDGSIQYTLIVHPVVKDTEYAPGMLVYEVFPSEANKLFGEFTSLFKEGGLTGAMELESVLEFSK
ncbi:MAG: hypothetical protein GEV06_01150 [Luteitalea sp.]|nr:hypothetical protein [Luteitalea sp.]